MKPTDLSVKKSGFAARPEGTSGRLAALANVDGPEPWRIKRWMFERDLTWARLRRPMLFTKDEEGLLTVPRPWLLRVWTIRARLRRTIWLARLWIETLLDRVRH